MGYLSKVKKLSNDSGAQIKNITDKDKSGKASSFVDNSRKGKAGAVWADSTKASMLPGQIAQKNLNPTKKQNSSNGSALPGDDISLSPTDQLARPENLVYNPEVYNPNSQDIYKAQAYNNPNADKMSSALNRRFDLLRSKAEGEANTQAQTAQDALARSAASRGRLGSGNVVKQGALLQKGLAGQKSDAINNIETQREVAVEDQNQKEADKAFAFNQEEQGRVFQSSEAANQRGFASQEAVKQRNYEKEAAYRDQNFKNLLYDQSNAQFKEQMNMSMKQLQMDKDVTEFNKKMAKKAANGGHRDIVQRGTNWYQGMGGK